MISIEQINGEIAVLEAEAPTHVIMQKLASLYTVRDHMLIGTPQTSIVDLQVIPPIGLNSEFSNAVENKNVYDVMKVMNELMDAVYVINPALYNSVIRKLP